MNTKSVRVLLDNSIISGAELAECVTIEKEHLWGNKIITIPLAGYRKKVSGDTSLQEEIDAIVTIGRLIREGVVTANTYSELRIEKFRRSATTKAFNSIAGCHISGCQAPIERSKLRQTANFSEFTSKGERKIKREILI